MLPGLEAMGKLAGEILAMMVGDLKRVRVSQEEELRQLPRYLDIYIGRRLAEKDSDQTFPTWEGGHLRSIHARVRESTGSLCRSMGRKPRQGDRDQFRRPNAG